MYDVHLGLIGKHLVDFLLVLIELYSLGVTAETTENRRFRFNMVSLTQNFREKGSSSSIIFAWMVSPMNDLQLCRRQFSYKETL